MSRNESFLFRFVPPCSFPDSLWLLFFPIEQQFRGMVNPFPRVRRKEEEKKSKGFFFSNEGET